MDCELSTSDVGSVRSAAATGIDDVLPAEVFDTIFERLRHVDEEKELLFACSLVSRSWRHRTLRHRFHSLSLFVRVVDPSLKQDRENAFIQDFVHSSIFPEVQTLVQDLKLRWPIGAISADFLPFLDDFVGLRRLELCGLLDDRVRVTTQPKALSSLKCLAIRGLHPIHRRMYAAEHDARTLCDILAIFPSVKELQLSEIPRLISHEDEPWDLKQWDLPVFSSLVVKNVSTRLLDEILRKALNDNQLKKLDILGFMGKDLDKWLDFSRSLNPMPEHICLSVSCWPGRDGGEHA